MSEKNRTDFGTAVLRAWAVPDVAKVACITVGAKRCWTQKHRSAVVLLVDLLDPKRMGNNG